MPNLVGIGNSQVPTNAMLGGLAYQDTDNVLIRGAEIENIAAIKAKIGGTARYVYVYNTSDDSDGGAWRYRCKDKSWYDEGPSEFRGHRKEFPAVAVIVSYDHTLTIFDGDDPNLSMWMHFDGNASATSFAAAYMLSSGIDQWNRGMHSCMLNGKLVVGGMDAYRDGVTIIDFVSDTGTKVMSDGTRHSPFGIIDRNRNNHYAATASPTGGAIRHNKPIDVDMNVLPDSKVDPRTGLPIPCIVICCDGSSVGIIHDNGETVYDIHSLWGEAPYRIAFEKKGNPYKFAFTGEWTRTVYVYDVSEITSDVTTGGRKAYYINSNIPKLVFGGGGHEPFYGKAGQLNINASALAPWWPGGLIKIQEDHNDQAQGMLCGITTNFNSGWLPVDTHIAVCNETDQRVDKSGKNLVLSGDGTSLTGWNNSGGTLSVTGGVFQYVTTGNQNAWYTLSGLTVGQYYTMTYTHKTGYTSAYIGSVTTSANGNFALRDVVSNSDVTRSRTWRATATTGYAVVYGIGTRTSTFDNVSVVETNHLGSTVNNYHNHGNLVRNGDFAALDGWGYASNGSTTSGNNNTASIDGGALKLVRGNDSNSVDVYRQTIYGFEPGEKYIFFARKVAGNIVINCQDAMSPIGQLTNPSETYIWREFTAASGQYSAKIDLWALNMNTTVKFDDIGVWKLGTNNKCNYSHGGGLYGNIERTPVADGAELLGHKFTNADAYYHFPRKSGDNSHNGLFDIGTGEFYVMAWFRNLTQTGGATILDLADSSSPRFFVSAMYNSNNIWIYLNNNSTGTVNWNLFTNQINDKDWWNFICVARSGTTIYASLNGSPWTTQTSGGAGGNLTLGSQGYITVGQNYTHGAGVGHSLALVRMGRRGIPEIEQVRQIYAEEKPMFRKNAKCTLYGTAAPSKICYDTKRDIIHMGSTSGRSDMRDLIRINNTTNSISQTMSASDGLIAEQ
tara:strand:- start:326 stop:3181 length:2856 start_codon:yes stop_codon:yes gene_type:complete